MSAEASLFRCIKSGHLIKFIPPFKNPFETIERWAKIIPSHPAVISQIYGTKETISRTWQQLLRRTLAGAKALLKLPAGRIAIVCGSHVATIETVVSSVLARRRFVCIDLLREPFDSQLYKLSDSKVSVLVIPALSEMPELLIDRINFIRHNTPGLKIWSFGENTLSSENLIDKVSGRYTMGDIDYPSQAWQEPTGLFYSIGRHGKPQGYFYQPAGISANFLAFAEKFKLNRKTRLLLTISPDSCDGLIPILATLFSGGTSILANQINGGNFWTTVQQTNGNLVRVGPSLIKDVLENKYSNVNVNQNNLKFIMTGSAFLPSQIGMRFLETFDIPLLQCYGTARTGSYVLAMGPGHSNRDYGIALRDNIVGDEMAFCNIRLAPGNGHTSKKESCHGEGILQVRGYSVSCGYWDGQTIQYWKEPWLETSDLAERAKLQQYEHQCYKIKGRIQDALLVGDELVWPVHIEQSLLNTFNFLRDCVTTTIPDGNGKAKLLAVVVMPGNIPKHRRNELLALMEARLSAGGVTGLGEQFSPRELILLEENQLPRLFDGQPDREKLHQMILRQVSRQGLAAS